MRHATVEVLSSYLDGELSEARQLRVERHLQECEECQHRLEGLHRVVESLGGLGRISPAPLLEQRVMREVAGTERRVSLLERLEKGAERVHVERWVWLPTFGMVIAQVSIIYLFSWGLQNQHRGTAVVLSPESPSVEESEETKATVSEMPSGVAEGSRVESTRPRREEVRFADSVAFSSVSQAAEVEGRQFELLDGIWIESGVDPTESWTSLDPGDAEIDRWQDVLPSLDELRRLGGAVRLRAGDQLVQLEFDLPR